MLHDLANDGDYVALKQAAKDRDGWTHTYVTSITASIAKKLLMMTLFLYQTANEPQSLASDCFSQSNDTQ